MAAAVAARTYRVYPVGTPGKAWGDAERAQWLALQTKKRDYFADVVSPLLRLPHLESFQYGAVDYRSKGAANYPLFGLRSIDWSPSRPLAVVTGGVHGYETSGVHGALLFAASHVGPFLEQRAVNVLILPCVSPWGYETINRWTPNAVDPNRCFTTLPQNPRCEEATLAMKAIAEHAARSASVLFHADCHETTDTDETEFGPAKTARDGAAPEEWHAIPDGFYGIANAHAPELDFHRAMIAAVAKVTHIAPADENGEICGDKVVDTGIALFDGRSIGLCGSHTEARFAVTTEVYPDSPKTNPDECNRAQVACIDTGLRFAIAAATVAAKTA
jgi:hypothetical protein